MPHEAQQIISSIVHHVQTSDRPDFSSWCIGLTSDVPKAYDSWGCPCGLVYWAAISLTHARSVESYFINEMKMKGLSRGDLYSEETARVCIFPQA